MKITIPASKLQSRGVIIPPETFEPIHSLIIDKDYYEKIEEQYKIISIFVDYEQYVRYLTYCSSNNIPSPPEPKNNYDIRPGTFLDIKKDDIIESLYENINYKTPVTIEVEKKNIDTFKDVFIILAKRYINILNNVSDESETTSKTSKDNLIWMCNRIIVDNLPDDKMSRWIGFIQGVMATKEYIDVDEERDFSRPLFHHLYNINNIEIPETKEKNIDLTTDIENKTEIRLHYNAWDKNNNLSEYISPKFNVNDKQILFLNFITDIIENDYPRCFYSKNKAIAYIKRNWNEFEEIIKDFSNDNNLEGNVMEYFDTEILEMLFEWFHDDYILTEFYKYDSVSDINPDGLENGRGVYAFERVV